MNKLLVCILLVTVFLVGCAPSTPDPLVIENKVNETIQALPSQTPYPTYTPLSTNSPLPTYTMVPTYTPDIKIVTATFTPTPVFTPTITSTPTNTATVTPTMDYLKETRGDGIYLVGIEIAPGVWDSDGTNDDCYWETSTATGDIIDNHFGLAGGTAYIPSTAFQVTFERCGNWTWLQN